jgi:hypothetical protein
VATVKMTPTRRPSALTPAHVPATTGARVAGANGVSDVFAKLRTEANRLAAAHAYVVGQPAVWFEVRTVFNPATTAGGTSTTQINNCIGTTTSAKGDGVAMAYLRDRKVSALRNLTVQAIQDDKVQGGDARGIPPRGRPV